MTQSSADCLGIMKLWSIEYNLFLHRNGVVVILDGLQKTHISMSFSSSFFNMRTTAFIVSVGNNKKLEGSKRRDERNRQRSERNTTEEDRELKAAREAIAMSIGKNSTDVDRMNAEAALKQLEEEKRAAEVLKIKEVKLCKDTVKELMKALHEANDGQVITCAKNPEDGDCAPRAIMQSMKQDEKLYPREDIFFREPRSGATGAPPTPITVKMVRQHVADILVDKEKNAAYRHYGRWGDEDGRTDTEMGELAMNASINEKKDESGRFWFERLHMKVVSDMTGLPIYLITVVMSSDASKGKWKVTQIMPSKAAHASGTFVNRALYLILFQYHNFAAHYHALQWRSASKNGETALGLCLPENITMERSPGFVSDFHSKEE